MIQLKANFDATKLDIMLKRLEDAAKAGMLDAMKKLAPIVVDEMGSAGIHEKSGRTAAAILASPAARFADNHELVIGSIPSPNVGGFHTGAWLQEGTNVPEVIAKKVLTIWQEGDTWKFAKGHKAFHTLARPFMNTALHNSETMIIETIRAHIVEALAA